MKGEQLKVKGKALRVAGCGLRVKCIGPQRNKLRPDEIAQRDFIGQAFHRASMAHRAEVHWFSWFYKPNKERISSRIFLEYLIQVSASSSENATSGVISGKLFG